MKPEWETEPNEWSGELCHARRNPTTLTWCGYVGIPAGHPWHGMDGDDIPADVHGGITWADRYLPWAEPDGLYWIGFDCAHSYDFMPGIQQTALLADGTYKNLSFVQDQIRSLMEQAVHAAIHNRKTHT